MRNLDTLVDTLRALKRETHELRRRIAGVEVRGKVKEVDANKLMLRLEIGKTDTGGSVLSPWVPWKQTAGALKIHSGPSIDQVMVIRSESGDIEQGVAEPFYWSETNPSPSNDLDEHVATLGDVKITLKGDSLLFEIAGVSLEISGAGVTINGGRVEHDGQNIGSTHVHGGVVKGSDDTLGPK
jgi:phage baseplate assembly protein gpV